MDNSDTFRKAANQCLALAQKTYDPGARADLLTIAQKWFELANGPDDESRLGVAVRTFNDERISRS